MFNANNKNLISVILGTYNRAESLKIALDSLVANDETGDVRYEVLVVDNNSNDKTKEVVQKYVAKMNGRVRYIFEPNQGLNYARNRGIRESRGDIVAFTDDDVIISKDWIVNIRNFFNTSDCDAVGGKVLPKYPKQTPGWIKKYQHLFLGAILAHDYGDGTMLYDRTRMVQFVGANMAFKKNVFDECGFFRTDIGVGQGTMGAETEIFNRLTERNKKICYCGKIVLWHPVEKRRMTLRFIAKWNIALGKYFVVKGEGKVGDDIVCYFRIPRYLIKRFLGNAGLLLINIFNAEQFLRLWVKVFRDMGMVIQYRKGRG